MRRSEQRILTTHVGSLPRPRDLLELSQQARDGGEAEQSAYASRLRDAVADAARRQADVGLDIINDGEQGKSSWANYVLERISGFELRPDEITPLVWLGRDRERFRDFFAEGDMPGALKGAPTEVCVGPIVYQGGQLVRRDLDNFAQALAPLPEQEAFFTAVAPASHLVQQSPQRYREWAQLRVDALNHALEDIPEDRVRYHVCFGSWHVPHVADAPLEEIVGFILQVRAGAYSIEAANPRHEHEWRVWESHKLAPGKSLIPGVVTHHLTTVEHPRLVADRIVRFARLVGRENVIAGTDCGFAQSQGVQRVHPTVMWAKFESLVEGARLASQELWS